MPLREPAAATRIDACHRDDPAFDEQVRGAYGYTVVGPDGRIGVVETQTYVNGALAFLTVRVGVLRRRTVEIPVQDVQWVLPRARMIILGAEE
jgi:hypothetical protein